MHDRSYRTALTSHSLVRSPEDQINILLAFTQKQTRLLYPRIKTTVWDIGQTKSFSWHYIKKSAFMFQRSSIHVCFWVGWKVAYAHKVKSENRSRQTARWRCSVSDALCTLALLFWLRYITAPVSEWKLWYFSLSYEVKGERWVIELWICLFWSRISGINWKCLTFPLRCTLGI